MWNSPQVEQCSFGVDGLAQADGVLWEVLASRIEICNIMYKKRTLSEQPEKS